jgi:hypothetical protein
MGIWSGLIKLKNNMKNFEKETIELITSLDVDLQNKLIEAIEWEKELSWSNGYADAVDQLEEKQLN